MEIRNQVKIKITKLAYTDRQTIKRAEKSETRTRKLFVRVSEPRELEYKRQYNKVYYLHIICTRFLRLKILVPVHVTCGARGLDKESIDQ